MADERSKKEQLLMNEIIDGGYDPMSFQVYCEQIKQDGSSDLDLWTYDELAKTITDFKRKEEQESLILVNKLNDLLDNPSNRKKDKHKHCIHIEFTLSQQSNYVISKNLEDQNFRTEVECQLPQRTLLTDYIMENTHKQVEILMTEFTTKSEGLFSSGYGAFKVETKPIGWVVWRRFSDFQKLRDVLIKSFPQHLIPPIPGKKIKVKGGTDALYLEKRMKVMELFLQNCLYHPLFKTHPAFSDFLSITEEAKLKERYQFYDKSKGPIKPSEYTMVNGACVLEITPDIGNYGTQLGNYLKNSGYVYKKLSQNFKKLFVDLDTLNSTLEAITGNFDNLEKVTENFIKSNPQPKEQQQPIMQIQVVYQELSKFMVGWQNGIVFQMKNVKENFYEFFRYHRKMQAQADEYLAQRNTLQTKFNDMKAKLNEKKEKQSSLIFRLFLQPDTSKWELPADIPKTIKELQVSKGDAFKYMLPGETQQLYTLRDNFAFMNHQLVDEVNQMMDFRIRVYAKKFLRVAQMRALETAKLHHVLANFLQIINELQGSATGNLQDRKSSVFMNAKYDQFFGIKQ